MGVPFATSMLMIWMAPSTDSGSSSRKIYGLTPIKDGKVWQEWKPKLRAFAIRTGLTACLDSARPSTKLTNIPRYSRFSAPGMPPRRVGVRLESDDELLTRQQEYDRLNSLLWASIMEAASEEAGTIVRGAPEGDGRSAAQLLLLTTSSREQTPRIGGPTSHWHLHRCP